MSILAKYTKQPVEVQDYDFDFTEYLQYHNDLAVSHTVTADEGVEIESSTLVRGVVKAFVSGGLTGASYKVSATITTQGGRVKQGDILIKVRDF
jgi:hypothetical protein